MSRAIAEFFFDDGDRTYGIYEGTSDYMLPFMSRDADEPWEWFYCRDRWKDRQSKKVFDSCEHDGEHVLVLSHYGGGFFWHGLACRDCMCFNGPYDPFDYPNVDHFDTETEARAFTPPLALPK